MTSPEALKHVRDILFRELVLPGNTGFWGVGIGNGRSYYTLMGPGQGGGLMCRAHTQ